MDSILAELRQAVSGELEGKLSPAIYWRATQVDVDEWNLPVVEWVAHPCQGLRTSWDALYIASGAVPIEAARIELLASTLSVPVKQEEIIEFDGEHWLVVRIELDAAGVMWVCQCTPTGGPDA